VLLAHALAEAVVLELREETARDPGEAAGAVVAEGRAIAPDLVPVRVVGGGGRVAGVVEGVGLARVAEGLGGAPNLRSRSSERAQHRGRIVQA
jgi:hypothetical protein